MRNRIIKYNIVTAEIEQNLEDLKILEDLNFCIKKNIEKLNYIESCLNSGNLTPKDREVLKLELLKMKGELVEAKKESKVLKILKNSGTNLLERSLDAVIANITELIRSVGSAVNTSLGKTLARICKTLFSVILIKYIWKYRKNILDFIKRV